MKINICLDVWGIGGAELGYKRIAAKLPQYEWRFTTEVDQEADLVLYSNNHRFYDQAKMLNKKIVQRMTGPRSYNLPQPDDLDAVICSSAAGFKISKHPRKHLIYNGIDFDHIAGINPIACDLLYAPARVGVGQCVEKAIEWSAKNKRHLTVLGAKQHLQEDTYGLLKRKHPEVAWTGLVDPNVASAYIKGCNTAIMPTSVHGVSNFLIECVANDKPIINLGLVEIPPKDQIDLNIAASKYDDLLKSIIK